MKITANHTIVAKNPKGQTIRLEPSQTGEVADTEANKKLLTEKQGVFPAAVRAGKKDDENPSAPWGRSMQHRAAELANKKKPEAKQTSSDDDKPETRKAKTARSREQLLGTGGRKEAEVGADGKSYKVVSSKPDGDEEGED